MLGITISNTLFIAVYWRYPSLASGAALSTSKSYFAGERQRSITSPSRVLALAYPITGDIFPFDVDTENASDDNVRVANLVQTECLVAVVFIRNADDAMHAALERNRRICDTWRTHEPRGLLLDVEFCEFVPPRLLPGIIHIFTLVVSKEP